MSDLHTLSALPRPSNSSLSRTAWTSTMKGTFSRMKSQPQRRKRSFLRMESWTCWNRTRWSLLHPRKHLSLLIGWPFPRAFLGPPRSGKSNDTRNPEFLGFRHKRSGWGSCYSRLINVAIRTPIFEVPFSTNVFPPPPATPVLQVEKGVLFFPSRG